MANHTIGVKIILHLMKCRHSRDDHVFSREVTVLGIAEALGITQSHAGNELRKLEEAGYVEAKREYVFEENRKLYVYTLTPAGRSFGLRLREKLEDAQGPAHEEVRRRLRGFTEREIVRRLSEVISMSDRGQPEPPAREN